MRDKNCPITQFDAISNSDLLMSKHNEECHAVKGKQLAAVFELKFINFIVLRKKMSQKVVSNPVLNEQAKMGSYFCTFSI
jgi:hypothetical protein